MLIFKFAHSAFTYWCELCQKFPAITKVSVFSLGRNKPVNKIIELTEKDKKNCQLSIGQLIYESDFPTFSKKKN
jgi:hypothetical protein